MKLPHQYGNERFKEMPALRYKKSSAAIKAVFVQLQPSDRGLNRL